MKQVKTVNQTKLLNDLLKRELAAAAMYGRASSRVTGETRVALEQNRQSHVARAVALAQEIRRVGGQPADSAGAWKLATNLLRGSLNLSEKLALKALYEGEMMLTENFMKSLDSLPFEERKLLREDIIPAQRETEARSQSLVARA